jgi:hypothetical protein
MAERLEVRSYRSVFELERRIYRIDSVRLNPAGVPLRGIAYGATIALAIAIASSLPVTGRLLAMVPWYLRLAVAPAALAALLTIVRIDGRPFHLAAIALLAQRIAPRQVAALSTCAPLGRCWRPSPLVLIPDGSDARMRPFRYRGPGAVLIRCAHERVEWGRTLLGRRLWRADVSVLGEAKAKPLARPCAVDLAAGVVLDVRVSTRRR